MKDPKTALDSVEDADNQVGEEIDDNLDLGIDYDSFAEVE